MGGGGGRRGGGEGRGKWKGGQVVVPMVLVMNIIPVIIIIKKDHVKLKGAPSPKGIHSQLNLSFEKKKKKWIEGY